MRGVCVLHTDMLELFVHSKNTLDRLLLPEIARWARMASDESHTLQYDRKDSEYFVKLYGDEIADSMVFYSHLPLSAVEELSMDVNEMTMTVMQDDGSTREIREELEVIRVRSTYVIVYTAELTDTATADCILEAFVKAVNNGV